MKKKLLITVGAGASIDFGLPSVSKIDELFDSLAGDRYPLAENPTSNLYRHIRDTIQSYYDKNPKPMLREQVNFEEVLYQINVLASAFADPSYYHGSNALLSPKYLPDVLVFNKESKQVDGYLLSQLSNILIDELVDCFIDKCEMMATNKSEQIAELRSFLKDLSNEFDVGIITLNYDNVFTQALPNLFTGFNFKTGDFEPFSVLSREQWGFIYHLHGSIHFSMNVIPPRDLHKIMWTTTPSKHHKVHSLGRGTQTSPEGTKHPISTIIAGYGKTQQVLRQPFRTYFAQVNRLVHEADSLLFIGYGFGDKHLNVAFSEVRNRHRPIVVIDWTNSSRNSLPELFPEPLPFRNDDWARNLFGTLVGNVDRMSQSGHSAPADIDNFKESNELEVSNDPDYPLAVWYNGLLEACRNRDNIIAHLK